MTGALDAAIDACGRLTPQANTKTPILLPQTSSFDAGGVAYTATAQLYNQVVNVTEHAFIEDITKQDIWPGQIIQGKSLTQGDIAPVGPLVRMPGTIGISGIVTGNPGPTSAMVTSPTEVTVNQAIEDLMATLKPTDTTSSAKINFDKAETYEQRGLDVGLKIKGAVFGVDAGATLHQDYKATTVVGVIRQTYYSVGFTPTEAGAAGIWQTGGSPVVTVADLQPYMQKGNPPLVVNSVQYGRIIVVAVTSSHSSTDLKATLDAHYDSTVSGTATLTAYQQSIMDSCSAQIYTVGVPGHNSFEDLGDPAKELPGVYVAGRSLNWPNNPGAIVSFTCRHITDNTLANVGLTASYTETESIVGEGVKGQQFQWFDGPGSHPVGDSIKLNPGDALTIRATGAIWTGVFGSGDTGPEGWPGHTPDPNAPCPASDRGTAAYCLVARIGNSKWFEVKNLYDGTVDGSKGQTGALQLASNDNIWTNGDKNKHWNITVDVTRTDAGSVGLYV